MNYHFDDLLEKSKNEIISKEEACFILKETEDKEKALQLFEAARYVREKEVGNIFRWSGEIAKVLKCNLMPLCNFCPYWRKGDQPLSDEEIIKAVAYISKHGFKEFHLSGGTTLGSAGLDVLGIVKNIRASGFYDIEININCGASMSLETLKELKALGVKKVNAVFETVNFVLFKMMKPGDDIWEKLHFAELVGEAGLQLGTGILAGLNSENDRYKYHDYVDFIFHIKNYEHLQSVYVSKFFPFEGIALKNHHACSNWEAARVISVLRLVLRNKDISSAQGWNKNEYPNPIMAGAGSKVGGIHISKLPIYKMTTSSNHFSRYEDGMIYYNDTKALEKEYQKYGITIYH